MGIMARDVVLCALVLLPLFCSSFSYQVGRIHGGRKLELPKRALSNADETNVLRSYLVHRDSLETNTTAKSSSERFLDAVKRSQSRVDHLQKSLRASDVETKATSLTSPVSAGSGEYVMQFSVGTPPQKFVTIVDTGSDLCWVQCSPCTHCYQQPDAVFNPLLSRTYSRASCTDPLCTALPSPTCSATNTCTYSYAYGDSSSTRGDLAYDTVTLNSAVSHIGIGCGHNQQGTFSGADGLVGLGRGSLSLPSQLSPAVAKIFSYCLVEQTSSNAAASSPITFGNAAENSAATYTPLLTNGQNPSFYYVGVSGISVGSTRVSIPTSAFAFQSSGDGGVILDSGTTLTYWRTAAFDPILAAFRRQIAYPETSAAPYGLSLCYDISGVDPSTLTFPGMVVHLTNFDFAIPMTNLFVSVDNSGQTVCLAMGPSDQFSIIGNIQQQNNLIVYDVVNLRIGFQAVDCSAVA